MKILVTGGAGFIGSNFLFYMEKTHPEDRLICLDKLTYAGNLSTLEPLIGLPNFRFVRGTSVTGTRCISSLRKSIPMWW